MTVYNVVKHWLEQHTVYESPRVENALIEAQQREVLILVARLDAVERRLEAKQREHDAYDG